MHHQWYPNVRDLWPNAGEVTRGDADDRKLFVVNLQVFAHYRWVATKSPLPELVAQDEDWMGAWCPVFIRREGLAEYGSAPQRRKIITRDESDVENFSIPSQRPVCGIHYAHGHWV